MGAQAQRAIEPVVFVKDGAVFANSRDVADLFGKRHTHVLRAIDALIAEVQAVEKATDLHQPKNGLMSGAACQLNFQPTSGRVVIGNGASRNERSYNMDRDAFTLLAMGFTGPKALKFKLAYIAAFNQMEATLQEIEAGAGVELLDEPVDPTDGMPPDRVRTNVLVSDRVYRLYGLQAARRVWEEMGMPTGQTPAGEPTGDSLTDFCTECLTAAPGQEIVATALYVTYVEWCRGREHDPVTQGMFGRRMGARYRKRTSGVVRYLDVAFRRPMLVPAGG